MIRLEIFFLLIHLTVKFISPFSVYFMAFDNKFTLGGATAANQYEGGYDEGGKGLNAVDVLTNGSATEPRKVTWKKPNGETGATPLVWGAKF